MHCDSKRDAKTDGTFYVIHNSPIWSADMAAEEEGERLPIRQVAPQIARVFLKIACQYPNAAKALRRYYRTSLILTLRQLENFVVTRVSRAAQKKADEMGVGDLSQYKYSQQETRMKAQPSPHFSDECEGLRQRFILSYEFSEAGDEWPQAGLGHVGYQLVEHAALPEQRMGSAFGGVDLEMTIHA